MAEAALNTDRELWREVEGDYYAPSLHVTAQGGIGMNVGGVVIVKPLREWHRLAATNPSIASDLIERLEATRFKADDWALINEGRPGSGLMVQCADRLSEAKRALSQLTREVDGLREALEPFELIQRGFFDPGNCGPDMPRDWPDRTRLVVKTEHDSFPQFHEFGLTVEDFRRAAEALYRSSGRVSDATE